MISKYFFKECKASNFKRTAATEIDKLSYLSSLCE